MSHHMDEFRNAIAAGGLTAPDVVQDDGIIHRFNTNGKRGDDSGWYVLHSDCVPAGSYGCWRAGSSFTWCAKPDTAMTTEERSAHRKRITAMGAQRELDQTQRQGEARESAAKLLQAAKAAMSHDYLARKAIQPHGVKCDGSHLVIPMRDTAGTLHSLQTIAPDGGKRFLPGGRVSGCYFGIGKPVDDMLIVCEGFATGASIHEGTGKAVVVAFNAGNLEPVAIALRAKHPTFKIVVAADDDHLTDGNPGINKATKAAQAVNGMVAVPLFPADRHDQATDFNDLASMVGLDEVKRQIEAALASYPSVLPNEESDTHRNAPQPDAACLYGLVGEVARAGSATTEANPYAVALNFLAYLSAAVGRGPYISVGNTRHHARIFSLHIGRTARGRKGDAIGLVHRIDKALRLKDQFIAPQVHAGGLSSREGLVMFVHDGFKDGKNEVEPIYDKRLWVIESEFANILQQSKRDGNTLSTALRDCWDGVSLKPATKSNRVWASNPHIALSGAVTPSELRSLMASRELTNGFANRFLMIWAERTNMLPFPKATPQHEVDALAEKVAAVLRLARADRPVDMDAIEMTLSPEAAALYATLYTGELNDQTSGELVIALLERRAPTMLRLAMLFALCDHSHEIKTPHINAALEWMRYWRESVKFVFASADDEAAVAETNEVARKIVDFVAGRARTTRTELTRYCFGGHLSKAQIDVALDQLLTSTPPQIVVQAVARPKTNPGAPTKFYVLAAKYAKSANTDNQCGSMEVLCKSEISELREQSQSDGVQSSQVRTVRELFKPFDDRANTRVSHSLQSSLATSNISEAEEIL